MYTPASQAMSNLEQQHQFMRQFSFATLIDAQLNATHLPLLLQANEQLGCLVGHFARANPHWQALNGQQVLAIFNGPHSYISPTWYANSPNVPTWNYAAVHAKGVLTLLNDDELSAAMADMIEFYEPSLAANTQMLAPDYVAKLSKAIVGFKIEITEIIGKEKLGQNRSTADQIGVATKLSQSSRLDDQALLTYMRQRGLGLGEG